MEATCIKSLLTLTLSVLIGMPSFAQRSESREIPIKVKRGSYIMLNDSLHYFSRDTILLLNNVYLNQGAESDSRTVVFYDSLKARASRNRLTAKLYDLVIVNPVGINETRKVKTSAENFGRYEGDIIREISIERLSPFGRNVDSHEEVESGEMGGFLNRTHITTRERIIMNYLLFKQGDSVSSFLLSESERLLRKLVFINDARVIVIPVSENMVDIHIVTKDVYSIGLTFSLDAIKAGRADLFDRNLFGIGHEMIFSFPYNYNRDKPNGFGASYLAKNIGRSLIDANFTYYNAFGKEYYEGYLAREFLTASTKYAGGIKIRETYTSEDLDTLDVPEPLEFNTFDTWIGRSFLVSRDEKRRLVISARYINNNVFKRPEISSNSYRSFQDYKLFLASASISTQEFYRTSLIYNYGRNEDIAYGGLFQFTAGRELNEFKVRNYYAAEGSYGDFNTRIGYLYGRGVIASFSNEGYTEQGMVKLDLKYISNLIAAGRYKTRLFANIGYTKGFYRYDDEYLRINDKYGIRGFKNDSVRTSERLTLNLEAVNFSPINVYGFKFIFFWFSDMALARKGDPLPVLNTLVSEIGFGLRIRNDNLIFNTIQFRLAYFPSPPDWSQTDYFNIAGEKLLRPPDFSPGAPGIYPYR